MNYLIIGAGGTGGCLGAYLARQGHDVTLIARGAHLAAIRESGLTLHSCRLGEINLKNVRACTADEYEGTPDVILVCVKFYSLAEITPLIARAAGPQTAVIPIVNVFGTGGLLAESVPQAEILDGCIYLNGMIAAPGVISQPSPIFRVYFGYRPDQPRRLEETVRRAESEMRDAGIDASFTDDIRTEALRKFSHVSPMGAAGLYHATNAGGMSRAGAEQDTFLALVREVASLGLAMGIDIGSDIAEVNLGIMQNLAPEATTSMQRDAAARRPTEIDGLVHRIVRLGREYNVPTPTYEKISRWAMETGLS